MGRKYLLKLEVKLFFMNDNRIKNKLNTTQISHYERLKKHYQFINEN